MLLSAIVMLIIRCESSDSMTLSEQSQQIAQSKIDFQLGQALGIKKKYTR